MNNKNYVALVEFFDDDGNSSYKAFDIFALSLFVAYRKISHKLLDDYSEYHTEIISIHRCFPRGE